jgi:hypothetical protein
MKNKLNLKKVQLTYLVSAVAIIVLAVLSLTQMNHTGYDVVTNFLTSNPLASQTNTVFAQASRVMFSFEMRWALFALLVLCLLTPLTYIYQIWSKYKKLDLRLYRNIDSAVTAIFMFLLIAILSGAQDISLLVFSGSLIAIGYLLACRYIKNKQSDKSLMVISTVSLFLPWLMIASYALNSVFYGNVRSPWYVYVLYVVVLVKVAMLLVAGHWAKSKNANKVSETAQEVAPVVISLLIKVAFVVVLIVGLSK